MFAVQADVPLAAPDDPVELLQVTEVTSAGAVPLTAMLAAEVDTMVKAGDVMFRFGGAPELGVRFEEGGVVGGGEVGFPGFDGVVGFAVDACLVTVTTREATVPALSTAVTVIVFVPTFSGTTGMLQIDVPSALPDAPWWV